MSRYPVVGTLCVESQRIVLVLVVILRSKIDSMLSVEQDRYKIQKPYILFRN